MKKTHLDKLIKITGDMEDIVLNMESMSKGEIDIRFAGVYTRLTEVVGSMMMEHDEMSGALE